jgi:hypothetical protein
VAQDQRTGHVVNRPGESALVLGIVAVLGLLVPGIGDYIAGPGAVAAMALGFVGMRRHETGRATTAGGAVAGVILGALALTALVIMLAASHGAA